LNQTIHHLKKDVRYFRYFLAGWFLLILLRAALLQAVDPTVNVRSRFSFEMTLAVLTGLQLTAAVGIIAQLIQNDPLVSTTAFWLTRPVSRRILLAAKSVFVLLFLIAVPLLAQSALLLLNGIALGDFFWLSLESVLKLGVLFIPIMVVAALTPNLSKFIVAGTVTILAVILGHIALMLWTDRLDWPKGSLTLNFSQTLAAYLLAVFFGLVVIVVQYLFRRTARTAVLAVLALVLVVATASLWPWDFFQPRERPLEESFDLGSVSVAVDFSRSYVRPGGGLPEVMGELKISGVKPGFVVSPIEVRPTVRFKEGTAVESRVIHSFSSSEVAPLLDQRHRAISEALGQVKLVGARPAEWPHTGLAIFNQDQFERYKREPGRYSAKIEFQVLKYQIAGELPLRKNARYDRGSAHAAIESVNSGSRSCVVTVRQSNPAIPWLDFFSQPQEVRYLLRNKATKEALLGPNYAFYFYNYTRMDWPLGLMIPSFRPLSRRSTLTFGSAEVPAGAIDSSWFGNAELVRLEVVTAGRFSRTVQADNFVMDRNEAR
jgi:hypothetical protein